MQPGNYDECADKACNHYPSYCNSPEPGMCTAWNPDTKDFKCHCKGRKEKPVGERNAEERKVISDRLAAEQAERERKSKW